MAYYKNLRNFSNYNIAELMATGINLGTGAQVYSTTSGTTLQFRTLVGAGGITITQSTNELKISAGGSDTALFPSGITVGSVSSFAGIKYGITNYTSTSFTPLSSDDVIICNGTLAQTVTLPSASTSAGQFYQFINYNTSGSSPAVTISAASGDSILGFGTTVNLSSTGDNISMISDGINRWIPR